MHLSVIDRTITLNAHEFADFTPGPLGARGARADLARAELGRIWHDEMRQQQLKQQAEARFEVSVSADLSFRGWRVRLDGRIDQVVEREGAPILREVKTVMRPLPAPEHELHTEYPQHFRQLAVYQCLFGGGETGVDPAGELVFVEPGSGFVQIVAQSSDAAHRLFEARLEELWNFAELRRAGLERLRHLRYTPAFTTPREGQETILDDLRAAATRSPVVLFEAPTGYGKTGCALDYALSELSAGKLTRLIYLTGKSTGQLQVVRQLAGMVGHPPGATWWQIRSKSEHCINDVYHCFPDACRFLADQDVRWPGSGLQRFAQDASLPHDLETLRTAGRHETICPYEITRASLPFTDIWIADYNYVFAPSNRSFLQNMPGFEPAHTLLVIDEAHNLPSRVADSFSSELTHEGARATLDALDHLGAPGPVVHAWERLTLFLSRIKPTESFDPDIEEQLHEHLADVAKRLATTPPDYAVLGPAASDALFRVLERSGADERGSRVMPEMVWAPDRGVIRFTCLDASAAIADTLHEFGHAVFLSATLSPIDVFTRECGLDRFAIPPAHLVACTPWRDGAYDVAIDARVDTRYEQRAKHERTTAAAMAAFHAAGDGPIVVFFPSFAYAQRIATLLDHVHTALRAVVQPRGLDLPAQQAFIEQSIAFTDVIILVLGSGFAEGIDLLGGRVAGAVVVGPALPEVNAVQRAKLAASRAVGRQGAFREVYQVPGMRKVNQALGRLVRAPGQRARVLLHCRRFSEASYLALLAPEYREAHVIADDHDFEAWLAGYRGR